MVEEATHMGKRAKDQDARRRRTRKKRCQPEEESAASDEPAALEPAAAGDDEDVFGDFIEEEDESAWQPTKEDDEGSDQEEPAAEVTAAGASRICAICLASSEKQEWFESIITGAGQSAPHGRVCKRCGIVCESFISMGNQEDIIRMYTTQAAFRVRFKGALYMLDNIGKCLKNWSPKEVRTQAEHSIELRQEAAFVLDDTFCAHFKSDWREVGGKVIKAVQLPSPFGGNLEGCIMTLESAVAAKIPHMVVSIATRRSMKMSDLFLNSTDELHAEHADQVFKKLSSDREKDIIPKPLLVKEFPKIDAYDSIKQAISEYQTKLKASGDNFLSHSGGNLQAADMAASSGTTTVSHSKFGTPLSLVSMPPPSAAKRSMCKKQPLAGSGALTTPVKRAKGPASSGGSDRGGSETDSVVVNTRRRAAATPPKGSEAEFVSVHEVVANNYQPGRELRAVTSGLTVRVWLWLWWWRWRWR